MKRQCAKCRYETDKPEGAHQCPVHHLYVDDGYCPLFVDGMTAAETAALWHGIACRERDDRKASQARLREFPHWLFDREPSLDWLFWPVLVGLAIVFPLMCAAGFR